MLYLISLGLFDELDLSLRGLQVAQQCDELYVEFYTTKMKTNAEALSKLIKKPVKEIIRADMEENSNWIIKKAAKKKIGIFVGGDALIATTHIGLLLELKKAGIKYEVIHGASIYTAVAETGLSIYKFGKTTTLTRDFSQSCYETILNNKKIGLHTLVLLDIDMNVEEGLKILKKKISHESNIVVCCQLGGQKIIKYGKIKNLLQDKNLNKVPAALIIPGELHFIEKEFLEGFN